MKSARKAKTQRARTLSEWGKHYGLRPSSVKKLRLRALTQVETSHLLKFPARAGGLLLPYFDVNGEITGHFRIRYEDYFDPWAKTLGNKPQRYTQRKDSGVHIHFPPLVDFQNIPEDATVIITEGEFKADKACQEGFFAIAIGGVAMWHHKDQRTLHPDLAEVVRGRTVAIVFDSDAKDKPEVNAQEFALTAALCASGVKAVKIARLPALSKGAKCGLDDYLIKHGKPALEKLIRTTKDCEHAQYLCDLFGRFFYVINGSYVVEAETGIRYTPTQFIKELTANRLVPVKAGEDPKISAGQAFMQCEARPEVRAEVYEPGKERVVGEHLNRWSGWGTLPLPGDVQPFLDLIEFLVPDKNLRNWLLDWLAYPLQHPGAKMSTAVIIVSHHHGVGKSSLSDTLRAIYGSENSTVIDQRGLESEFNAPLAGKQFIVGEETTGREQRKIADVLKNLITAPTILVNEKYKPHVELANRANFLFLTNHADAFHLEDSDRRFAVIECASEPCKLEFYAAFHKWLDNEGAAHLFDYLLRRDLSGFNPHAHAPRTEAKEEMQAASRSRIAAWVHELHEDPDTIPIDLYSQQKRVLSLHTADELLKMFGEDKKFSVKALTLALKPLFKKACDGRVVRLKDRSARLWIIRPSKEIEAMSETEIAALYRAEREVIAPKHARKGGAK